MDTKKILFVVCMLLISLISSAQIVIAEEDNQPPVARYVGLPYIGFEG